MKQKKMVSTIQRTDKSLLKRARKALPVENTKKIKNKKQFQSLIYQAKNNNNNDK